jgi:transcriptional regulator with XRE-family HTH domain
MTGAQIAAWRSSHPELRRPRRGPTPVGCSQRDLAEALTAANFPVSLRTVQQWEAGVNTPPPWLPTALAILAAMNKSAPREECVWFSPNIPAD